MGRSKRRTLLAFVATMATFSAIACNSLVGISDYDRGECSGGGVCSEVEGGPIPDAKTDTSSTDAPIIVGDAEGSRPVSWAQFRMPNYPQDGGPSDNVHSYGPVTDGFKDNVSNLVWREPMTQTGPKSFSDAKTICALLPGGWRLPSRIELVTLLDLGRSGTKIDPIFATTEAAEYWTISEVRTVGGVTTDRWTVDFNNGGVGKKNLNGGTAGVRCIKDQP